MQIQTQRLNIYPMSDAQMKSLIAEQTVQELKEAYQEMLDSCLTYPDQRNWYALWNLERNDESKAIVGYLSFRGLGNDGILEIGYGTNPEYENQGYMTEAVSAVVRWASVQAGVTRIEAETTADNLASQRVLQKTGFIPSGEIGEEGPRYVWKQCGD